MARLLWILVAAGVLTRAEEKWVRIRTGPFEILNAGGMIANGEPHLHITLSSAAKGAFGGHLEKGCRILYLAEVTIVKFAGPPLIRKDNENGISLLQANTSTQPQP